MSPNKKPKKRKSQSTERTIRPKLSDFKRNLGKEKSMDPTIESQNIESISSRARGPGETKSLHSRRMDNIFDDFRNSIETMMNPLSSWGNFPSYGGLGAETGERVRIPVYDMVDDGDSYKLIVELPGIDRDNIHIRAMDDFIEISAEQSREEDKRKKNYVYNRRSYSSFFCTIPTPEEILSAKVSAKTDNKGILRVELPKKIKPRDIKSRTIPVQ